ncbi:hypothetical protein BU24DRAFT_478004 [Aaosphaeria arxii CBS 175.79]|uniref:RBR-type E3 ubiquitin transferase n=1 Tax=Aaosphaeria arxii CBS 175.79 TaxID=1450172 RepID=A0A6A5XVK6_9PLEO|nr:uncharacterized protein BU24DRAFT_478004 [Aaosphaeria arxii CBS 175.79]KAF2016979.1 hypothetical protein BU24DRAFT_478004 [Aaosphaeria arxii CBS 175.79]
MQAAPPGSRFYRSHCFVCGDKGSDLLPLIRLPCGYHVVCRDPDSQCLAHTFRVATHDEGMFPAKCCKEIPLIDEYRPLMPEKLFAKYESREREWRVPPKSRTYCSNAKCAVFIHPDKQHDVAGQKIVRCGDCSTSTCVKCRVNLHHGRDCGKPNCGRCASKLTVAIRAHECKVSKEERKFKEEIKAGNLQECPWCGRKIELTKDCNRMFCPCRTVFCYICGKEWKGVHGCPTQGKAIYDKDGYNQRGYHRDTGLDRNGNEYRSMRHGLDDFDAFDEDEVMDEINGLMEE